MSIIILINVTSINGLLLAFLLCISHCTAATEAEMNLRRLKYFVKIVDIGSLTQAAEVLHIAQPALSQQLATLEGELKQQLLIRTKRGVTPTEAGNILYMPATTTLRPPDQAHSAVNSAGQSLTAQVPMGLALGRVSTKLAMPLLQAVREQHPGILLYLNENFTSTLSDLVIEGRMDMAVLYDHPPVKGLSFVNASSIDQPLSLSVSDRQTLSQPAQAVQRILLTLVERESNRVAEPLLAVG